MVFAPNADLVFADGPSSQPYQPTKSEIRRLFKQYEQAIEAFSSGAGSIAKQTEAQLVADLAHDADTTAWVYNDGDRSGIYRKIGASGAGSWARILPLPYSFIIASDVGAGTPNAIQATTSMPVSNSALVWLQIADTNTGSPVSVSFNDGAPLTVKTNTGNNVSPGGLSAGMVVVGIVLGTTFRLLNDQVSSAIVAAAEAAANAAIAAANSNYTFENMTAFTGATVSGSVSFLTVAGFYEAGDGGGSRWKRLAAGAWTATPYRRLVDGKWFEMEASFPVRSVAFGTSPALADNGQALQDAFDFAQYLGHNWTEIGPGFHKIDGWKFSWDETVDGVRIMGVSQGDIGNPDMGTVLAVVGTPTKVKCTRENWVAAYESGSSFDMADYSASTDDPIAWLFKFGGFYCQMRDIAIYNQWPSNEVVNPPVNWGADYDAAIVVQGRYFTAHNVRVVGAWRRAGLLEDWTQWNKSTDAMGLYQCEFTGRWGYESMGPKSSNDLNANDRRGVGGNSDMTAIGCRFYSVRRNHAPAGGFVRYPAPIVGGVDHAGAMKRSGRAPNTGGKGQGHRFYNCRFHAVSRFLTLLDFDSRTEFFGCHWEGQAGFRADGVTALNTANSSASDFRIEFTANSTRTRAYGGEASGIWVQEDQPHLLGLNSGAAYTGGGSRWFGGEVNQDAGEVLAQWAEGTWTPVLKGSATTGTVTYTIQNGTFIKQGRLITAFFSIACSAFSATGNLQIDGLPLRVRPQAGYTGGGAIYIAQGITMGSGRTQLMASAAQNTFLVQITAAGSGQAFANQDAAGAASTAWLHGFVTYLTEF